VTQLPPGTLTALIVDDEPLARRGIRQLLAPHPEVAVVGECGDGREAVRLIRQLHPGLVFLDIQMPAMSGFDVIRAIGAEWMPMVVFVTAYDEFAVRAFDAHAVDYLVKPVAAQRFRDTMARVLDRRRRDTVLDLAERLRALLGTGVGGERGVDEGARGERRQGEPRVEVRDSVAEGAMERLAVPTAHGLTMVALADIRWIEADDYYAALHVGTRRLLIRESLSSLAARLDGRRFLRVHRSAIVAIGEVAELRGAGAGSETVLVLRDGTRVPVSRRRREAVEEALRRGG